MDEEEVREMRESERQIGTRLGRKWSKERKIAGEHYPKNFVLQEVGGTEPL